MKQIGNIFLKSNKIRNIEIPIFGNGDIDSQKALEYKQKYACDGMMIGRAAIGYPWILMKLNIF